MRHLSYPRVGPKASSFRRTALGLLTVLALLCCGEGITTGITGAANGTTASHAPVTVSPATGPPPPAPLSIPNAYSMSLTVATPLPVTASWTYIDGMPGLNAQLDSWLLGVLDAKMGHYRPAMTLNTGKPAGSGPRITLTAQPVKASGTVIVLRESEQDSAADGSRTNTSRTIYADTSTGEVHNATDLLRPDGIPGIRAIVVSSAADQGAVPPPEGGILQDLLLDPEGTMQVSTPAKGIHDHLAQAAMVTIGTSETGNALSDFGRKVLDQVRSQAPVAVPPATAAGLKHVNCDLVPCAALTYDDGPEPKTTPQLLSILREKNAMATFFMQGVNASKNPGIAKQVSDAGHALGNHTYSHPNLTRLSAATIKSEIDRTGAVIKAAAGIAPTFMRPPYGATNAAVQGTVGMPLMLWSVDSQDWLSKNPAIFVPKVLKEITPGAVVIMHDVHPTTIAGQAELMSNLQSQGYHLVTIQQLFDGIPLNPGQTYRSRPGRTQP
ncbi:polysaccharide deacetylase family protein [Arthrobacter sp. UYEF21]|uniref:polysaccharide deacetylase family protein n=1 Tax=Arthrobacter sp. UYEF21 TaxID=1756364 RepID=UPI0033955B2D